MLPETICTLLDGLRSRERWLALAWSAARWFTTLAVVLVLFALVDYTIDLRMDTPSWLRFVLGLTMVVLLFVALGKVVLDGEQRLRREQIALWVEASHPALHHRLISAVQFQRQGAETKGMSPDLIDAVTQQAVQLASEVQPSHVLPGDRFRRAALLAGPVFGALLLLILLNPALAWALLGRMFGGDHEIPRSVQLVAGTATWPAGEEGVVQIVVTGRLPAPTTSGVVRVQREDGTVSHHVLELAEVVPDHPGTAIYTARVPAGDSPFHYTARLADGRTRLAGAIDYAPRPVVQTVQAWAQFTLDQKQYQEPQKAGDIVHRLPNSRARVVVTTQKPIVSGALLIASTPPRLVPLVLVSGAKAAEATFDLRANDTGYEVEVRDDHGFTNTDRPRRTISPGSLELPDVSLLPENFAPKGHSGPSEDYEAEGVPVAVGAPFKIEYAAAHRYGLSHAQLRYRVLPRSAAKEESGAIDLTKFQVLPLGPTRGQKDRPTAQALREFSTRSPASDSGIPDTIGGGTYDFELTGISDGMGGRLKIGEGDRIQFFVEVFSKADPDGSPGRSVVREKEVVSEKGYTSWFIQKINLTERTRELEERQRGAAPGRVP